MTVLDTMREYVETCEAKWEAALAEFEALAKRLNESGAELCDARRALKAKEEAREKEAAK